ncbi:hypothetical protein [Streptomyces sasae]|uniref:hypothetical protein n=1 Tax=Streptomyces sasae TaxID=1266772 RepID=UPI0029311936|nr:hypothetical protein [Streptomyces sasae]
MIDAAQIIESGTNILFVTFGSLRQDVAHTAAENGRTPRLAGLLPGGQWERRQTPGTFTLPAHMAFFSSSGRAVWAMTPRIAAWRCWTRWAGLRRSRRRRLQDRTTSGPMPARSASVTVRITQAVQACKCESTA